MSVSQVSTEPFVTHTQTIPSAVNASQILSVTLRVLPRAPLSERKQDGEVLGSSRQEPQGPRPISAEQGRGGVARLRELARRGAWRQLENQLAQVEEQLSQEQLEEWQQWVGEWVQAAQGRESSRLFLFGTLFCRVLAPALSAQTDSANRLKWELLIKRLSAILQQLLPQGRLVEEFLRICEQSWFHYLQGLEATARQNASLGQILEQITTLPLSIERQQQLDQWIEGLLSIPSENTEMQLLHCAVLIVRYLRPLMHDIREQALKMLLAKIEEDVCRWIESRLPQGESIEEFMQQARSGLIEEAVTRMHLQLIDEVTSQTSTQLEERVNAVQQQRQISRNQLTQALTSVQQQRQALLSTTTRVEQVADALQQAQGTMHTQLTTLALIAQQEESAQARLASQVSRLQQEAKRL